MTQEDIYGAGFGDGFDVGMVIPTENGVALDRLNQALNASPAWQRFMIERFGTNPNDPTSANPIIRLTDRDRKLLQSEIERFIGPFPSGMEIDPAGNINQNQGFFAHWYFWVPALAAATIVTMGVAGWGPLAGVLSAGGGGTAAGGVALAGGGTAAAAAGGGTAATIATIAGAAPGIIRTVQNRNNQPTPNTPTSTTRPPTTLGGVNLSSTQWLVLAGVAALLLFD